MATYRHLQMHQGTTPGDPPAENVVARRPATRLSVHQQMHAQDRIIGSGRRILMQLPLGPVPGTWIVDDDPATGVVDPIYPDVDTEYVLARSPTVCVTPGSVLRAHLMAIPSGATVKNNGTEISPDWVADAAGGAVIISVTLTHPDTTTITETRDIEIKPSQLDYAAKPDGAGDCWGIVEEHAEWFVPLDFDVDPAVAAKWSASFLTATITISQRGSPRVIDLTIYEHPREVVRDIETATRYPTHLYTQGGAPHQGYPLTFPVEQATATDPRFGMEHLIEVAKEQGLQLGPMIACGSCWDHQSTIGDMFSTSAYGGDDFGQTGDDEAPAIETTTTSFHHLLNSAWTTWSADLPGYSMGCGAYGRHARSSGTLITPNSGSVDVVLAVYGNVGIGADGTWRWQASEHAYWDILVTEATDTWHLIEAEVPCGTGPEDDFTLVPMTKAGAASSMFSRYWAIFYRADP